MNLYGYADGDPINKSDPFGLCPMCEVAGAMITDAMTRTYNPTGGAVRGCDAQYGCGHYGASRDGGTREHAGADYLGEAGQDVVAMRSGRVRIGQPYSTGSERLVEITAVDGSVVQQHYVQPGAGVTNGAFVFGGTSIGKLQSLQPRYPGIAEHSHTVIKRNGKTVDPAKEIP